MKKSIVRFTKISAIGAALIATNLYASGYKMEFQSPSILADAGEAAAINDAGTNWYNSAGLVYLPHQAVFSVIDVYAPTTFTGTVIGTSGINGAPTFNAYGSASSHPNSALPAFHYALPFLDRFAFGLTVAPAWGFMEDYGENSLVRYDVTRIYTKTIDIAPSLAWKINQQWSVGAGPDFHYFSVLSRSHVYTQPIGTPGDSVSRFSADNWGYGAHFGVLFRLNDTTRIGLNYRTKIIMDLDGFSDFQLSGGPAFETNQFNIRIPLPPVTTLTAYHEFTPDFALMGTVAYDQWSILNTYHAHNYQSPVGVVPNVEQPQKMSNTIDLSIGTHYRLNDVWLLRGSFKYEPTPTNNQYRDVNFPDGEKYGINLGARYQMNKKIGFDFIYGHVFVRSAHINGVYPKEVFPNVPTTVAASGHSNTSIDLIGAQVVWNI